MRYTHQFIQIDSFAPSFCYYHTDSFNKNNYELIKFDKLQEALNEAVLMNTNITVIYSNMNLPFEYLNILNSIEHEKIYPFELISRFNAGILVLNEEDLTKVSLLQKDGARHIILRISQKKIMDLFEIICSLEGTFSKLTIVLLDIDTFSREDINNYKEQLIKIRQMIVNWLSIKQNAEINILTDRLLLHEMNNCDAGLKHFTLAPDGNKYICPAFYFDRNLSSNDTIISHNSDLRLLNINSSPICSICDAYHCKRCVYTNKKITQEYNIPFKEQCIVSHEERNQSKELRAEIISKIKNLKDLSPIPEINYLDPFELLKQKNHDLIKNSILPDKIYQGSTDLSSLTDREILMRIYEQNRNILDYLIKQEK